MSKYPWLKARLGARGNKEGKPTQTKLAKHLGIPDGYVTKIFSGEREIQQSEIPMIAEFFGITSDEVLTGKKSKSQTAEIVNDASVALLCAIKVLMQILLHNGQVTTRSFIAAFSSLEAEFQDKGQAGAVLVMQELASFASGDPLHPEGGPSNDVIRKLLQLAPLGRA